MWSLGTIIASKDDLDQIDEEGRGVSQSGYGAEEAAKAEHEARKAVKALVRSGVLGDGPFRITGNGHSNPAGGGDSSDGPDFLQITITFDPTAEVPTVEELAMSRGEGQPVAGGGVVIGEASPEAATAPSGETGNRKNGADS